MWQARRQWKHLAQTQPDQVLRISRAHQVFKQAHKAFKHAGKACRKQWFYDKIDELQAAAGRGDTRSLFAGIRTVAPGGQAAPSSQQLSLPGPQADTPAQVPLQDWPLVHRHLQNGTWMQLIEHEAVQKYLQHHCPVCLQWAATPAGIKCHMTNQHAEWQTLQPSIHSLLQGFRRHTVVPCRYCHQDKINKDRHWYQCQCQVLSLCAFLRVRHDRTNGQLCGSNGHGRAGEDVLRASGTGEERASDVRCQCDPPDAGSCQAATPGAAGSLQGQRRERQKQGQGQGPSSSRTVLAKRRLSPVSGMGLQQWFGRGAVDTLGGRSDCSPPQLSDHSSWMGERSLQRTDRDHRETADWMEHRLNRLTQLVLR